MRVGIGVAIAIENVIVGGTTRVWSGGVGVGCL